jgi:hypothetical protein
MLCLNEFQSATATGECVIAGWADLDKQVRNPAEE